MLIEVQNQKLLMVDLGLKSVLRNVKLKRNTNHELKKEKRTKEKK